LWVSQNQFQDGYGAIPVLALTAALRYPTDPCVTRTAFVW